MTAADDRFVEQALRVHRRYLVEVVEAYGLCPWAERSRREGHVTERVLAQQNLDELAPALDVITALEQDEQIEIGLVIFARLDCARVDFEHLVARIREVDGERYPRGEAPFAMAAFHPDAPPHTDSPDRLIPFLRRSPYPTIQLVRFSVLERVRGRTPHGTAFVDLQTFDPAMFTADPAVPVRDRIAQTNLETVKRVGTEELERVIRDIQRDRDETAARYPAG